MTKILLIGSGGREHAIAWALSKSPRVEQLYVCPGNAGIAQIATPILTDISNHEGVAQYCKEKDIDLVIVGPEAPLVDGLADSLRQHDIAVFGPGKEASQLEGSKEFTKQICERYSIPTAASQAFTNADEAKEYVNKQSLPIVIKADGLAAGKGVVIAHTMDEALAAIDAMLVDKQFGTASELIVIEEFLIGEEASFFALCDGDHVVPFGSAQDHKAVGEGDTGPNTGGMGTYSPAPVVTNALEKEVMETIITPLVEGLKSENIDYKGVIFAGLMVTETGPKLLEINVRFGDPETQVLMSRLDSDLAEILLAAATGQLHNIEVKLADQAAVCVVMASNGYPGNYEKGSEIKNLDQAASLDGTVIFHAGTKKSDDKIVAIGGRVLGVTAIAPSVKEAQNNAYQAVDTIDWPEGFCRRDIAWRAVKAS